MKAIIHTQDAKQFSVDDTEVVAGVEVIIGETSYRLQEEGDSLLKITKVAKTADQDRIVVVMTGAENSTLIQ